MLTLPAEVIEISPAPVAVGVPVPAESCPRVRLPPPESLRELETLTLPVFSEPPAVAVRLPEPEALVIRIAPPVATGAAANTSSLSKPAGVLPNDAIEALAMSVLLTTERLSIVALVPASSSVS